MAITKGKENISLENTLNSFNKTRSEMQTLNVAKEKSKHLFFLFLTFKTITNSKKEIMIFNITLLSINLEHTVSILFKIQVKLSLLSPAILLYESLPDEIIP